MGSDRDVAQAFKAWGLPEPHMVKLEQLSAALFVLEEVTDARMTGSIIAFLQNHTGTQNHGGDCGPALVLGEVANWGDLVSSAEYDRIHDVSLKHIHSVVGVNDITINRLTGSVTAQAFFEVDLEYTGARLESDGETTSHAVTIPRAIIRDVLAFTLNDTGRPTQARSEIGVAYATLAASAFADPWDAFAELLDAMTLIPGITRDVDDLDDAVVGRELTWQIEGWELTFTSEPGDGDAHWSATLGLSRDSTSDSFELRCEWDGSLTPYDDPDLLPAYVIVAHDGTTHGGSGEWAAPAWVVNTVWPRSIET